MIDFKKDLLKAYFGESLAREVLQPLRRVKGVIGGRTLDMRRSKEENTNRKVLDRPIANLDIRLSQSL